MSVLTELEEKGQRASQAARKLRLLSTNVKNQALLMMAEALEENMVMLLAANSQDVLAAKEKGQKEALLDRLLLTEERIKVIAEGLKNIASLPDPIGEFTGMQCRPNGLQIAEMRVPLGVIGIIYEARPNVTADAAGLCLKAGNAVLLRGGSEAICSNMAIVTCLAKAAAEAGIPDGALQLITATDRQAVQAMLKLNKYIDVIIPRGGAGLIRTVVENSTVPVIETGTGVCHTFVDATADLSMAAEVAYNAKVSRPAVCNAMETLLVHKAVAEKFLPDMLERYLKAGVEIRGCEQTSKYHLAVGAAQEQDWDTEYLDLILAVRVVDSLEEAIEHIEKYGTGHSEAIITNDYNIARRFQQEVDAAVVYVNASTRFTDGFEFGYGAEIGISTQKLHARGPMGLKALTSVKYIVAGNGQIR